LLATKHGTYELPIHIMLQSAHTADVVMGVDAVSRFHKLLLRHLGTEANVRNWLFDKGYDATAYYKLLNELNGRPVIPLRQTSATPVDANQIVRDENGNPLCAGNVPMRRHAFDRHSQTATHCCCAKYLGRTNGKPEYKVDMSRCPLGTLCEPESTLGPYVHLSLHKDYRLNTEIARDSELFKELYNQRTCTERQFSVMEAMGLKDGAYRRNHTFLIASLAFCLGVHAKAWLKHRRETTGEQPAKTCDELFARLEKILEEKAAKSKK
jgi:hypothetical protein